MNVERVYPRCSGRTNEALDLYDENDLVVTALMSCANATMRSSISRCSRCYSSHCCQVNVKYDRVKVGGSGSGSSPRRPDRLAAAVNLTTPRLNFQMRTLSSNPTSTHQPTLHTTHAINTTFAPQIARANRLQLPTYDPRQISLDNLTCARSLDTPGARSTGPARDEQRVNDKRV